MPRGVLTTVRERIASLVQDDIVRRGKCGNWITVKLVGKGKITVIINVCRILATSNSDSTCSILIQYNLVDRETKSASQCRNEIFKEIEEHAKKNNDANDIMISRDMNHSVTSRAMQAFFNSIEALDAHHKCNNIDLK